MNAQYGGFTPDVMGLIPDPGLGQEHDNGANTITA